MTATASAPGLSFSDKVIVIGGGLLASFALSVLNPVLPKIDAALAHSPTDSMLVRQLFGFTSMAMAAGAPLGAYLARLMGMRRMLLCATLIYTLAGTSGLYLTSLPLLLVSRLLVGTTAAAIQVMSLTLVNTKAEGNDRAKWMGLHVSFATLITLGVSPLSGFIGNISWHLPFAEYVIGLALFAALVFDRNSSEAPLARQSGDKSSILSWFPWHYIPLSFLIGAVTFLPTAYGPFLLAEKVDMSPRGIGLVLMGSAGMGALFASQYGRARRVLSAHQAFVLSFGLAGIGAFIAAYTNVFPLLLAGLLAHALGVAWFVPNIMTALGAKLTSEQQAHAAGLVKTAHFISAPICIYLKDTFLGRSGASTAMLTVTVLSTAVVLAMLARMATAGKAAAVPAE
jgi:MFS family permease